jgi:LysM repeat protein
MEKVKQVVSFFLFIILGFSLNAQPAEYRMSRQEYIERFKEEAIKEMHLYGIPASITLAQGILESGDGNSPLARYANNHFGIKCHKGWTGPSFIQDDDAKNECFRKYHNPEESYRDHSEFLKRPRYAALFELKPTDYKGWAHGLKKAGYATNPKYAELLIKLIEDNNLQQYDRTPAMAQAGQKQKGPKVTPVKQPQAPEGNSGAVTTTALSKSNASLNIKVNNNVKYVIARKGDTPESIAKELMMKPGQIKKFNEMNKYSEIKVGDKVYLQPKRNKSFTHEYHIVNEGENLQKVSELYGVKLTKICAYNFLEPESLVHPGDKIFLRKNRRN